MSDIQTFDSVDAYIASFPPPERGYTPEQQRFIDERYGALRKLERRCKENIGQLVLVIERKYRPGGQSRCERWFPEMKERFRMGILQAPGFQIRKANDATFLPWTVGIATAHHALGDKIVEGPICDGFESSYLVSLDAPLEADPYWLGKRRAKVEVVIGNEAIHAWAVKYEKEERVQAMTKLLGRTLAFPTLQVRYRAERDRLAQGIEAAWAKSSILRRRIRSIEEAGRRGVGPISLDGVSVTLCENPDDAFWISLGDRQRLEEADDNLIRTLRRIIELGVDDTTPNIHLIRHIAQQLGIALK